MNFATHNLIVALEAKIKELEERVKKLEESKLTVTLPRKDRHGT